MRRRVEGGWNLWGGKSQGTLIFPYGFSPPPELTGGLTMIYENLDVSLGRAAMRTGTTAAGAWT